MKPHDKKSASEEFGFFRCIIYIGQWIAASVFIAAVIVIGKEMLR